MRTIAALLMTTNVAGSCSAGDLGTIHIPVGSFLPYEKALNGKNQYHQDALGTQMVKAFCSRV